MQFGIFETNRTYQYTFCQNSSFGDIDQLWRSFTFSSSSCESLRSDALIFTLIELSVIRLTQVSLGDTLIRRTLTPSQIEKYSTTEPPRWQGYHVTPERYDRVYQVKKDLNVSPERLKKIAYKSDILYEENAKLIEERSSEHSRKLREISQERKRVMKKIRASRSKSVAYRSLCRGLNTYYDIPYEEALAAYRDEQRREITGKSETASSANRKSVMKKLARLKIGSKKKSSIEDRGDQLEDDLLERVQQQKASILANMPSEYFDIVSSRDKVKTINRTRDTLTAKEQRALRKAELKEGAIMQEHPLSASYLEEIYQHAVARHEREGRNLADWMVFMRHKANKWMRKGMEVARQEETAYSASDSELFGDDTDANFEVEYVGQ